MIAGHLIKYPGGWEGKFGFGYDYVMASTGLYVLAANDFIHAQTLIAPAEVRGLGKAAPFLTLAHGPVPGGLFELALNAFLVEPDRERYLAITYSDGYHLWQPEQLVSEAKVEYQAMDNVVLELHSHTGSAFFSDQDDKDEQGLKVYGVVGLNPLSVKLRLGIYGYFKEVKFAEVFDGACPIEEAG